MQLNRYADSVSFSDYRQLTIELQLNESPWKRSCRQLRQCFQPVWYLQLKYLIQKILFHRDQEFVRIGHEEFDSSFTVSIDLIVG